MVALEDKSGDHQNQLVSFYVDHDFLFNSFKSIQKLFRYFSVDQSGGPTKADQPTQGQPMSHAVGIAK